jgi:hypothetical protein
VPKRIGAEDAGGRNHAKPPELSAADARRQRKGRAWVKLLSAPSRRLREHSDSRSIIASFANETRASAVLGPGPVPDSRPKRRILCGVSSPSARQGIEFAIFQSVRVFNRSLDDGVDCTGVVALVHDLLHLPHWARARALR